MKKKKKVENNSTNNYDNIKSLSRLGFGLDLIFDWADQGFINSFKLFELFQPLFIFINNFQQYLMIIVVE